MKQLIRRIGPLLLAFVLGVGANVVWDHRHQIPKCFADPFVYYQDQSTFNIRF